MTKVDVLVIGGGPAGSTAAAILAKEGHDVMLVERDTFPRHHIGESFQPAAFDLLDLHLDLKPTVEAMGFHRKYGALYRWGERDEPWSVLFDPRLDDDVCATMSHEALRASDHVHAYHVDRARFDKMLLDEAVRRGAKLVKADVLAPLRDGERVTGATLSHADGSTEAVHATVVVDCSGQATVLGRALGLMQQHTDLRSLAVYGYFDGCDGLPGALGRDATYIVSVPQGWVWFIPISDTRTSIGLVTDRKADLDEAAFLEVVHAAGIPMGDGQLVTDAHGGRLRRVRDWSYVLTRAGGPGWVAVGDAAGFVDPILSGGGEFAIRGACNAAIAIDKALHAQAEGGDVDAPLLAYDATYRAEHKGYLKLARYWYGNNRNVEGFFWEAHKQIPAARDHLDTPLRAFVYLTSGRYDADSHFKVFIDWQEQKIFERLGVDKKQLAKAVAKAKSKRLAT